MMVEHTPNTDMKFSLRVKKNLLLFVTALVIVSGMRFATTGRHLGLMGSEHSLSLGSVRTLF
jgi:hypothetical protein